MPRRYDVFICHAHEDKEKLVRPLVEALRRNGLHVWFDEFELRVGASLSKSITTGLEESDFAIVFLSPNFLDKAWPKKELDALAAGERQKGVPRILPLWHNVTASQVREISPLLADRLALETDRGIERVAKEVSRAVLGKGEPRRPRCAVLIPLSPDFTKLHEVVSLSLQTAGIEVMRIEDAGFPAGAMFLEKTMEAIRMADFVVADVTGSNQNVLFKLGMVYALAKPIILLASNRSETYLPLDLVGYRYISYDPDHLDRLAPDLQRAARRHADVGGLR